MVPLVPLASVYAGMCLIFAGRQAGRDMTDRWAGRQAGRESC